MGDLSIEQIKLKAFQARDLFNTYIDNLVTAGETRKANDTEIDLFNLDSFYFNKKIDNFEATKLKEKINSIDLNYLISSQAINYIQAQGKFSANKGSGDLNSDEIINLKDLGALNYILNFKGDPIEALDYMFSIAGDSDKISDYYIRKWARERGINSGSQAFEQFYNKFYNTYYKQSDPKLEVSSLQQAVKLYDLGVGKENLNEIDKYIPLVKVGYNFSIIANLYYFQKSSLFDVPEEQKSTKLNSYINILVSNDTEKIKIFQEALTRKSVPISGEELKVSTLDPILEIAGDNIKINRFTINRWADQRKLTGEDKQKFVEKFFGEFYNQGSEGGLRIGLLKNLLNIYDDSKAKLGSNFNIDLLNIYAEGLKKDLPMDLMSWIYKFEKSSVFKFTGLEREDVINKYFNAFTKGDRNTKSLIFQAFRYNQIPFTKEPLSIENINKFLDQISTAEGIVDLTIDNWARERKIINIENSLTDDYDLFFNKLKSYYSRGFNVGQIKNLLTFYDKGKFRPEEINKLDVYARGMQKEISLKSLMNLFKFEQSTSFELTQEAREAQLDTYMDLMKNGTIQEKELIERTLISGKKVFLTGENISVANLNKALEEIKKPNGFEFLQFETFANERELSSTEKEVFISKLKEWFLPQTEPKVNYQISIGDISNLLSLEKDKKLNLDQLDVYAKAIRDRVPFKLLGFIYKFETGNIFKSQAVIREAQVDKYIQILKSDKKEKIGQMLNSMKSGKLPITGEEINLTKFDEILNKFDSTSQLTELYIDTWSKNKLNPQDFKNKFMSLYNDKNYTLGELSSLKSLFETNINFPLNDLDTYALAIKDKLDFKLVAKIFKLNSDSKFRGSQEQINSYLQIIRTKDKNKLFVLSQALMSNNIPYINERLTTENSINLEKLDEILNFVEDQEKINKIVIGNMAKSMGLKENTTEYEDYMNKFYKKYFLEDKISISLLKTLHGFYSSREYNFEQMDKMVSALKEGLDIRILSKLEQISRKNNFSTELFYQYINILLGKEGEDKKKILLELIRSNQIPYSGIRI